MTHSQLIELAARWLRKEHVVVATEIVTRGVEQADALGWGRTTTLIECKASRTDFLRDSRKIFRRYPDWGMGHVRYYLAPRGVIHVNDLPEHWGLLVVGKGDRVQRVARAQPITQSIAAVRRESAVLVSCLRRIGQSAPAGLSIKCYQYETKRTATLGIAVDNRDLLP